MNPWYDHVAYPETGRGRRSARRRALRWLAIWAGLIIFTVAVIIAMHSYTP